MTAEIGASPEASVPAEGDSALGRVVGVFFSPSRTFASIAARPTWIAPLLLWTAVSLLFTAVLLPKIDYEKAIRQAMEKRGQTVPEERMASIVETQKKVSTVIGWVIGACAPVLVTLLVAVVYWGVFKAFGWEATFRQARGATAHAFLPAVLGSLLAIPLLARLDRVDPAAIGDMLRSNLGFLVERDSKALHSLLSSIDVFSFWSLLLLTFGFAAAAKVRRGQAAGVIVGIWAIYVIGKAGISAIF